MGVYCCAESRVLASPLLADCVARCWIGKYRAGSGRVECSTPRRLNATVPPPPSRVLGARSPGEVSAFHSARLFVFHSGA